MGQLTLETGFMGVLTEMASLLTSKEKCMMESGGTTKHLGLGCTCTAMEPDTKDSGRRTCKMAMEKKHGPTAQSSKDNISKERNVGMVSTSGRTVRTTRASGTRMKSTASGFTSGMTAGSTWGLGSLTL